MTVRLCKAALMKLGAAAPTLLSDLRERQQTPIIQDCLDRCTLCETGVLVAFVDGMPVAPKTPAELLALIDELADE